MRVLARTLARRCLSSTPGFKYKVIPFPKFSPSVSAGRIVEWYKAEGDEVESTELIFAAEVQELSPDIEGAKVLDVEAHDDGFLARVVVGDGEEAAANSAVAVLVEEREHIAFFRSEDGEKLIADLPEDVTLGTNPFLWQAFLKD